METIYVLADGINQKIRNTYSGMTQEAITQLLTNAGYTNIQFVTKTEWDAAEVIPFVRL